MKDFFENTMAFMNWKEIKEAGEKNCQLRHLVMPAIQRDMKQ